jgi:hypothetical protein
MAVAGRSITAPVDGIDTWESISMSPATVL